MDGFLVFMGDLTRSLLRCILLIVKYGQKRMVPPSTDEILFLSATSLASMIRSGKVTSQKVVETYIERIKEVQPYVNGLAEDRFDLALKEAIEVDELIASRKMTIKQIEEDKPLLGVPFSVKNYIAVEGMSFNGSCAFFKDKKSDHDSDIVQRMKRSGAVVLGTSNTPELALNFMATNKLYGATKNPHDSRMFPGISSSGDAALNGANAIPFAIGNDLFGSIRLPSSYCGVFGHRPTCGLIPKQTLFPNASEKTTSKVSHGPICRHAEDLVTVMKVILGPKGKELCIGQKVDFSKLTIYYTHSFPRREATISEVDEEVLWTILRVANYFKEKFGSNVEYIDIDELTHASDITKSESKLGFDNTLKKNFQMGGSSGSVKIEILKSIFGKSDFLFTTLIPYFFFKSFTSNYRMFPKIRIKAENLKRKLKELFQGQSILLYPSQPKKYIYTEEYGLNGAGTIFCGIFSLFEIPVTQCPVGFCDEGLPLGLQVIAGKYQDNLTLSVASEIEKGFRMKLYQSKCQRDE